GTCPRRLLRVAPPYETGSRAVGWHPPPNRQLTQAPAGTRGTSSHAGPPGRARPGGSHPGCAVAPAPAPAAILPPVPRLVDHRALHGAARAIVVAAGSEE